MPVMCSWIFLILSSLTIQVFLRVRLPLAHTQPRTRQSSALPITVQEAFAENCDRIHAYRRRVPPAQHRTGALLSLIQTRGPVLMIICERVSARRWFLWAADLRFTNFR